MSCAHHVVVNPFSCQPLPYFENQGRLVAYPDRTISSATDTHLCLARGGVAMQQGGGESTCLTRN